MYQLRNLINRRNVKTDVSKDMNSCEKFMEIIVSSHIIAAALQVIGVGDAASAFNSDSSLSLDSVLEAIVSQYINLSCVGGSII